MRSPEGAGKEIFNSTSTRCLPSRRLASSCSRSHRTSWWTRIEAILRTQMFESFGSIVLTKAGPSLFLLGGAMGISSTSSSGTSANLRWQLVAVLCCRSVLSACWHGWHCCYRAPQRARRRCLGLYLETPTFPSAALPTRS